MLDIALVDPPLPRSGWVRLRRRDESLWFGVRGVGHDFDEWQPTPLRALDLARPNDRVRASYKLGRIGWVLIEIEADRLSCEDEDEVGVFLDFCEEHGLRGEYDDDLIVAARHCLHGDRR
ncbi:MAG: hypothetical protein AAFZ07_20360 [Actinomycetota bacterium]